MRDAFRRFICCGAQLRILRFVLLSVCALLATNGGAQADETCPAQSVLAAIGHHYNLLHNQEGSRRALTAHLLDNLVGDMSASSLGNQLESEGKAVHIEVLRTVLIRVRRDATSILAGRDLSELRYPDPLLAHTFSDLTCGDGVHVPSAEMLAELKPGDGESGVASDEGEEDREGEGETTENEGADGLSPAEQELSSLSSPPNLSLGDRIRSSPSLNVLFRPGEVPAFLRGVIVTMLVLAGGWYLYMGSRLYRIDQDRRMPRYPTNIEIGILYPNTSVTTNLRCVDVSQGGMKIARAEPTEQPNEIGKVLTLQLPFGELPASIAWANAHFFGVVFDRQIGKKDMKRLLSPV